MKTGNKMSKKVAPAQSVYFLSGAICINKLDSFYTNVGHTCIFGTGLDVACH